MKVRPDDINQKRSIVSKLHNHLTTRWIFVFYISLMVCIMEVIALLTHTDGQIFSALVGILTLVIGYALGKNGSKDGDK